MAAEKKKNRIEQLIEEIEDYVEGCKFKFMSSTEIVVNKEELMHLILDLKRKTPEELAKLQKVLDQRDLLITDAKRQAQELIDQAAARTNEMVNQNSIMQQAYAQADQVVKDAYQSARELLTNATLEANAIKASAVEYLDGQLASFEAMFEDTMNVTQAHYEGLQAQLQHDYAQFYSTLAEYHKVVVDNRLELSGVANEEPESIPEFSENDGFAQDIQGSVGTSDISIPGTSEIPSVSPSPNTASMASGGAPQTANNPGDKNNETKIDLI